MKQGLPLERGAACAARRIGAAAGLGDGGRRLLVDRRPFATRGSSKPGPVDPYGAHGLHGVAQIMRAQAGVS
jgi:hypothetical protein